MIFSFAGTSPRKFEYTASLCFTKSSKVARPAGDERSNEIDSLLRLKASKNRESSSCA